MNTITNSDINTIKNSIIFKDIDEKDILPMLGCLSPTKKSYKKGSYILNQGEYIDFVCLIISGSVRIENIDIWGNRITNSDINTIKNSIIFKDIDEKDILPMLGCLSPTKKSYKKGSYILNQGEYIDFVCLIISGSVRIENIDIWGNRKIMSELTKIDIFAESYACVTNEPLMVDAIASSDCVILTMNMNKVMTTCPSSCNFHNKLIK